MLPIVRTALFAAAALTACNSPAGAQKLDPHMLVEQALAAQGGTAALRSIRTVRLHEMVRHEALEQSVRPEGPYFEDFSDVVETRRFESPALRIDARTRGYSSDWWASAKWAQTSTLVTGGGALQTREGKSVPTSQDAADQASVSLELGPERALLTALQAPDLAIAPRALFHGYLHDVVTFHWQGSPVRVFLEPVSHMPAAVEIVRTHPLNVFWSPWGDVTTLTEWDGWTVEPGGIRYPRRLTVTSNGRVESATMIDQIEFNPTADVAALDAPADLIAAARAKRRPIESIPFPTGKGKEIAPGIQFFEGAWNTSDIRTPDGVYLIEGPISNSYSAAAIAQAKSTGSKILGVITTSDSWPHIGGLREYAAQHIPIIALDRNRPQIERLLASPHVLKPDALALSHAKTQLRFIGERTALGSGANAMQLIPIGTVTGERQLAIYWPSLKLLYTSDLFAVADGKIWLPEYRDEMASMIAREKLDVKTVFGMHYGPTPWSNVETMSAPAGQ